MHEKLIKSKKFKVFLLSLFTSVLVVIIGFFAFSAYGLFYALYSGSERGSAYFLKKSDMIFFNGHNGLKLINPGILSNGLGWSDGSHYGAFYYIFVISIFLSLAIIASMFIYFYTIIVRHENMESTLKSVEKNILEIPSTIIHEIKGNINSLSINSRVLGEKIKKLKIGAKPQRNGLDDRQSLASSAELIGSRNNIYGGDIERITGIIESETHRLTETMDNILRFTKEYSLNLEKISLYDLINRAVEKSIPNALSKGVNITPSSISRDIYIRMDADLMEQVFVNLISNAVESYAGEDAEKRIGRDVLIYSSFYIDKIIINIEDNGKGIRKEILQKIYEPFFTTKRNGAGLGLPLVKRILDAHGFKIKIDSFIEKGTKVSVVLKNLEN